MLMKQPLNVLGQPDLTKCEMGEVGMQTAESYSIIKATDKVVKILDITYAKADLDKIYSASI